MSTLENFLLGLDGSTLIREGPDDVLDDVGVISRFRRTITVYKPEKVIVSPKGLASTVYDSTDYADGPKQLVERVVVLGGRRWVPNWDKKMTYFDNPKSVVVHLPGGASRAFDNAQLLTLFGGKSSMAILGYAASSPLEAGDVEDAGIVLDDVVDPIDAVPPPPPLQSPLPGVSDEAWTKFCRVMQTQGAGDVSASNALGLFALKPRRLADLGIVRQVSSVRAPNGRMVWTGEFIRPMTSDKFLKDSVAQYNAFVRSMKDYAGRIKSGDIPQPEGGASGITLSGALAILHRAGPGGLKHWNKEGERFPETVALFEKANRVF